MGCKDIFFPPLQHVPQHLIRQHPECGPKTSKKGLDSAALEFQRPDTSVIFFSLVPSQLCLSTAILMKPPGTSSGRIFLLDTTGRILMLKAFGVKHEHIQSSDILPNISFEIGKLPRNL